MTAHLFSPIRSATSSFPNRIAVAPMCQYSADDGVASDWHLQHWMMLAMSGAGMVTVEMTDVERRGPHHATAATASIPTPARRRAARARRGAAGGGAGHEVRRAARPCRAQGLVPPALGGRRAAAGRRGSLADRLRLGHPLRRRLAHARGARRRRHRGAGRELRRRGPAGASGRASTSSSCTAPTAISCNQFLSPLSNRRGDAWGGSLANRLRLPLEVSPRCARRCRG